MSLKRRGVAGIIATIFLVMLMGIAMVAIISIHNEYRDLYATQARMNEWEAQRLKEKLVDVREGGGGGGEAAYVFNRVFLVSDESASEDKIPNETPKLYLLDKADGKVIEYDWSEKLEVDFEILTSELQWYQGEWGSWDFVLKLRFLAQIRRGEASVKVYVYNKVTGQYDEVDSFKTGYEEGWYERAIPLEWGTHVDSRNVRVKIVMKGEKGAQLYLNVDQMVLEGRYRYMSTQPLTSARYYVTNIDGALKERDGNFLEIYEGEEQKQIFTISRVPTNCYYVDISAFLTLGTYHSSYSIRIYAYNFSGGNWVFKKGISLTSDDERRVRVPLSPDYISKNGEIKLKIEPTITGGGNPLLLDEVAVDASWLQTSGGGGPPGGQLLIRNESPFTSRIVRIWYIGDDFIYAYDPTPLIALQPGETMNPATYHSLKGVKLVKVVTDLGNVFSFVP